MDKWENCSRNKNTTILLQGGSHTYKKENQLSLKTRYRCYYSWVERRECRAGKLGMCMLLVHIASLAGNQAFWDIAKPWTFHTNHCAS